MQELLVSTRNPHKIREISQLLGPAFTIRDLSALPGMDEVAETGSTFGENAALKALAASALFHGYVIADDSGLEVDALGGAPGVLSARFAGPGASDTANNTLLLERLENISARSARFRCVIALAHNQNLIASFEGCIEGTITTSPTGSRGFGYDPLFIPRGHPTTFANLPAEIKNSISHRARALAKLKHFLTSAAMPAAQESSASAPCRPSQ
jgi:XTP/dITP diphosphohydrolase